MTKPVYFWYIGKLKRSKYLLPQLKEKVVVKACEKGVTIIGLTRGKETVVHHTEKLDEGEVWISQFTEHVSAINIRGRAEILSKYGRVESSK